MRKETIDTWCGVDGESGDRYRRAQGISTTSTEWGEMMPAAESGCAKGFRREGW